MKNNKKTKIEQECACGKTNSMAEHKIGCKERLKHFEIDGVNLTQHLLSDSPYNWIIEEGIKKFTNGSIGNATIKFLEKLNIIKRHE